MGVVIGSPIAGYLLSNYKPKNMMCYTSLISVLCLILFGVASFRSIEMAKDTRLILFIISRFVLGVMQTFSSV